MRAPRLVAAALALLAFGAAGTYTHHLYQLSLDRSQRQAVVALQIADRATHQADAATAASRRLAEHADSIQLAADAATARADSLAGRELALRRQLHVVAVPDTCRPLVALADSALAQADSSAAQLRVALAGQRQRGDSLSVALDSTTTALTHLRAATGQLGAATHALVAASHKSFLARVLPSFGVGEAAGLDALGRPHVITGITLGWSF